MPLNERKIIEIIFEECKSVEERCDGYRQEIIGAITDIVSAERQHMVQGTNIQQRINDKCNATGRFLAEAENDGEKEE